MSDTMTMTAILIITGVAVFSALSVRYGAESRPGFDESKPLS